MICCDAVSCNAGNEYRKKITEFVSDTLYVRGISFIGIFFRFSVTILQTYHRIEFNENWLAQMIENAEVFLGDEIRFPSI